MRSLENNEELETINKEFDADLRKFAEIFPDREKEDETENHQS